MKNKQKFSYLIFAVLPSVFVPLPANAICVGLGCNCTISTAPLNFGSYNPIAGTAVDAVGDVEVTCGGLTLGIDVSYEITLSAGASGDQVNRHMLDGTNTLSYGLFTNASRSVVWGDGSGGTSDTQNSYSLISVLSRTDNFPVYGRLFGGQNAVPGSYADTITATVIF